jgi:hypothetical protein
MSGRWRDVDGDDVGGDDVDDDDVDHVDADDEDEDGAMALMRMSMTREGA